MKIVCLGNEFIEEDCFAKKVGEILKKGFSSKDGSAGFDVVNIKDSFELMGIISSGDDFVILDVVEGLDEVRILKVEGLRVDAIMSAHDFDAGFVLGLLDFAPKGVPSQIQTKDELGQTLPPAQVASADADKVGNVRIVGIPMRGDVVEVAGEVLGLIEEMGTKDNFGHGFHG